MKRLASPPAPWMGPAKTKRIKKQQTSSLLASDSIGPSRRSSPHPKFNGNRDAKEVPTRLKLQQTEPFSPEWLQKCTIRPWQSVKNCTPRFDLLRFIAGSQMWTRGELTENVRTHLNNSRSWPQERRRSTRPRSIWKSLVPSIRASCLPGGSRDCPIVLRSDEAGRAGWQSRYITDLILRLCQSQ